MQAEEFNAALLDGLHALDGYHYGLVIGNTNDQAFEAALRGPGDSCYRLRINRGNGKVDLLPLAA